MSSTTQGTCNLPTVYRNRVAHWPAVQHWSLPYLAQLGGNSPVQLVEGNRERHRTRFACATLGDYLRYCQDSPRDTPLYLKEFDLLKALPQLQADLNYSDIFTPRVTRSVRAWIGPAKAATGLHYDHLDNMVVQLVGRKRFHLVRPGVVEQLGLVSSKYDAWAVLAKTGVAELMNTVSAQHIAAGNFVVIDLEPGDVLHLPATWWHEVTNLSASVSFGGFYGPHLRVAARWAQVQARAQWHRIHKRSRRNCTCHPHSN
jgi:hypothetical protein